MYKGKKWNKLVKKGRGARGDVSSSGSKEGAGALALGKALGSCLLACSLVFKLVEGGLVQRSTKLLIMGAPPPLQHYCLLCQPPHPAKLA